MSDWKPDSYTSAAPYLIVRDAAATIAFLEATFGARRLRTYSRPDGKLKHAEVRIDDTVVMLADETEGWPSMPAYVHVYVPDVDAVFARALAAGGTEVQKPVQKDDEDKRGGVKDPGGTTWWIATEVGL